MSFDPMEAFKWLLDTSMSAAVVAGVMGAIFFKAMKMVTSSLVTQSTESMQVMARSFRETMDRLQAEESDCRGKREKNEEKLFEETAKQGQEISALKAQCQAAEALRRG